MITFKQKGSFRHTEQFFKRAKSRELYQRVEKYARDGVAALSAATPMDSGTTANSWNYEIRFGRGTVNIYWTNSNLSDGIPVAILIQYGHGTRNGGYVQGVDYINPALRPIFDQIADSVWREVTK